MGNKIEAIPEKAEKVLNELVEEFGIKVLKDFIKNYNRKNRKIRIKHNTRDEVVRDVLNLIVYNGYNRKKAVEEIAKQRNLAEKTIDNHLTNFYKEAKKNNFYTLGFIYEELQNSYFKYSTKEAMFHNFCILNDIDKDKWELYYLRYKSLPEKEKKKYKLDFDNIKLLKGFKDIRAIYNLIPHRFSDAPSPTINIPDDEIPF